MNRPYDVCIRGAGIVGSALSLLLAQQRLRVALVRIPARAPQPPGAAPVATADVRAYALNAASRALLESVRAWPEAEPSAAGPASLPPAVTPIERMRIHGDAGATLHFAAADVGAPALAWMVDVPALEQQLAQALRYQPQVQLLDAEVDCPPAALTVVCEGRHSSSRGAAGLAERSHTYPHHAIAARLRLAAPHRGEARQWFSPQGIVALLPIGGAGSDEAALVWSAPSARAQALMTQADGEHALLEALRPICPGEAEPVALTAAPQLWPLQHAQASRWTLPGLALAGDAAHAMHPLAGQGLNIGLGDAAALAAVLREREYWRELGDPKLLRRYERQRKAAFARMGQLTDGLFQLFSFDAAPVRSLRNWGLSGLDRLAPAKRWLIRQAMA